MKTKQLAFQTVLDDSFRSHERKLLSYMVANVEQYKGFARLITPSLADSSQVFSRVAFAILSANARFEDSVKALDYAVERFEYGRNFTEADLISLQMVPAKAEYLTLAAIKVSQELEWFERSELETWQEYRERLIGIKGLGRAKASFACCLLYPLEADLACVDTWIQKVFLGNAGFRNLSKPTYEQVEAKIRAYARRFNVSTFLAQWLIWDHARGGQANNHAIFPGSHK